MGRSLGALYLQGAAFNSESPIADPVPMRQYQRHIEQRSIAASPKARWRVMDSRQQRRVSLMAQIDDIHAENTGRLSLTDDDDTVRLRKSLGFLLRGTAKILARFVLYTATDCSLAPSWVRDYSGP